jgi:hypothetical protein
MNSTRKRTVERVVSSAALAGTHDLHPTRRAVVLAPAFAALSLVLSGTRAPAGILNPSQTAITLPDAVQWTPWSGVPPHSGEVATLYGGLDTPGPYLVLMKWCPPSASENTSGSRRLPMGSGTSTLAL